MMPFALPAVLVVLIVTGFLLGGPAVGFVVAAVAALAIVFAAVRAGSPVFGRWSPAPTLRRMVVPLAVAVVGVMIVLATTGTARIVGWGLIAVAAVLAVSAIFLEVGYSEDRARERDERPRFTAANAHPKPRDAP